MTTTEFHGYVTDCLSRIGEFKTKKMMGEYCLYYKGKLVGDICDNRVLVKRTLTSDRMLSDMPLEYPYEGSKQLMYVLDDMENTEKMKELFDGVYSELPIKKSKQGNAANLV